MKNSIHAIKRLQSMFLGGWNSRNSRIKSDERRFLKLETGFLKVTTDVFDCLSEKIKIYVRHEDYTVSSIIINLKESETYISYRNRLEYDCIKYEPKGHPATYIFHKPVTINRRPFYVTCS